MFFLITHNDNQKTEEKYLLRSVNGTPRIISMYFNLSLLSPITIITESKRIANFLDEYNIKYKLMEEELSNFEKVEHIAKTDGYESAISIFTPESFLEDIEKMDGILNVYRSGGKLLRSEDNSVLTFFTTDKKIKMRRNSYVSLNKWGGVESFSTNEKTEVRQIGFYVLNPKTLYFLNKLGEEEEFKELKVNKELREENKLVYYSVPMKLKELKNLKIKRTLLKKRG